MTNPMMTLNTLLEKTSDADILREMIGFARCLIPAFDGVD